MKVCISGPTCSGKTYFVNGLKHDRVITYNDTTREIFRQNPALIENPLLFTTVIWHKQIEKEQNVTNTSKIVSVFDRGIIDNLAFLRIYGEEKMYKSKLQETKSMLENNEIAPYDVIFYFDIEYTITELLQNALNDTLRTLTINANYFEHHLKEFKEAFKSTAKSLNLKDKVVYLKYRSTAEEYNKRNEFVAQKIYSLLTMS